MFLLVFLMIILGVAQGPGLRWAAEKYAPEYLQKIGLKGTFHVEGSLLTGISLKSVKLSGPGIIREIEANSLSVDYRLSKIIHGQIDAIHGDSLHVWIDLNGEPFPESEEKDDSPSTVQLESIRQMVLPISVQLLNTSIRLTRGDDPLWHAQSLDLVHKSHSENFQLAIGKFSDMKNLTLNNQVVDLWFKHQFVSLSGFPIQSNLIVTELLCTLDNLTPTHLQSKIHWEDGDFSINLDHLKKAEISINQGEIDLRKIADLAGPDLVMAGKINTLHATVDDVMAPPHQMNATLKLAGKNLQWKDKKITSTHIALALKENHLSLSTDLVIDKESPTKLSAQIELSPPPSPQTSQSSQELWTTCWHNASVTATLDIPKIEDLPDSIIQLAQLDKIQTPPGGWPKGSIQLTARASMLGDSLSSVHAKLLWPQPSWANIQWQNLSLIADYDAKHSSVDTSLTFNLSEKESIQADAHYVMTSEQYSASLNITALDISKLQPALTLFNQTIPRGGIVDLAWSGEGKATDLLSYQGKIETTISNLETEAKGQPTANISLKANYTKNLQVELESLDLKRDHLHLISSGNWKDNFIDISHLELRDDKELLVQGHAKIPFSQNISDLEGFLQQSGNIDVALHIKDLPLKRIFDQIPTDLKKEANATSPQSKKSSATASSVRNPTKPQDTQVTSKKTAQPKQTAKRQQPVTGKLTLDLVISGSLASPSIQLNTKAQQLRLPGDSPIPPCDAFLTLATTNQQSIKLDGKITPTGHPSILLSGKMPFHPKKWIESPDSLMNEPIEAIIDTKSVDLAPYASLAPQVSKIDGHIIIQVKAKGTVKTPQLEGTAKIDIQRFDFLSEKLPDLRDIDIQLRFANNRLTIEPSKCMAAGGSYKLHGSVDLKDFSQPVFDISLVADKALIIRDDKMIVRTDADIKLTGPYKQAKLSGNIGITESLFYKDIQILPIGGSGSASPLPGKAKLPSFTKHHTKGESTSPIPAPFKDWLIDLKIKSKEHFLIRGNLAEGKVFIDLAISGKFSDPKPSGKVTIRRLEASLPFSQLHVKHGEIIFTPQSGFDPRLNLKAVSRVGDTDVEITIYGKASSPQYLLSSTPPQPENEIVFLLATGSTSDKLTNSSAAAGKAYQLLLDTWLRSNPGKLKTLKYLVSLVNKSVNINIGATDQFTGKQFNSATIKIHDKWYIIASMDLENNSRGLLLYTIHFK